MEAFTDYLKVDYQGLPGSEITVNEKTELLNLTTFYNNNMKQRDAHIKTAKITKHIDKPYFTWIGLTDEEAFFYYRIISPVLFIEFDHHAPAGLNGAGKQPTRNHIHTIVRTPNGNDYSKDLLRQHLE